MQYRIYFDNQIIDPLERIQERDNYATPAPPELWTIRLLERPAIPIYSKVVANYWSPIRFFATAGLAPQSFAESLQEWPELDTHENN